MGDTPTPEAPATGAPIPTTPPVTTIDHSDVAPDDEVLGEPGKKALAAERKARRELEAQIKQLQPLAKAAKEREDAEKSELQKLNESLTGERDARTQAELTLIKYQVAADKGVPPKLAKFLTGTNQEEVEQAADDLLAELGPAKPSMPGRPTERMVNGKPSGSQLDGTDPMTLIRMGRGQEAPK
jgi:hypothetical protein